MADIDLDNFDDLIDKLEALSDTFKDFAKDVNAAMAAQKQQTQQTAGASKEIKLFAKDMRKLGDDIAKETYRYNSGTAKTKKAAAEQLKLIEEELKARQKYIKAKQDDGDNQLDWTKQLQDTNSALANLPKGFGTLSKQWGELATESVTLGGVWKMTGLAAGASIKTFSNVAPTVTNFGKALQTASMAASDTQPATKLMVGGLGLVTKGLGKLGPAAMVLSTALTAIIAIIELLGSRVEQVHKTFDTVAKSGATFTDGMTGMIDAAYNSNLKLEQFQKVVTSNSKTLAFFGGSVTEGAAKLGKSLNQLDMEGGSLRRQLLNLGYSYEDQAEGLSDYMGMLQRSGHLRNMSDRQVAQQSTEYLTNLRAISAITGEEAKAAKERAREASTQGAVYSQLRKIGGDALAKFETSIAAVPQEFQQLAKEMIAFRGPITESQAIIASQNPAMYKALQTWAANIRNTSASTRDTLDAYINAVANSAQRIDREGVRVAETFGQLEIASGKYGDISKAGFAASQLGLKAMNEGFRNATQAANDAAMTQDQMTHSVMTTTMAMHDSVVNLEYDLNKKILPAFAGVQATIAGGIKELIDELQKITEFFPRIIESIIHFFEPVFKMATSIAEYFGLGDTGKTAAGIGAAIASAIVPAVGLIAGGKKLYNLAKAGIDAYTGVGQALPGSGGQWWPTTVQGGAAQAAKQPGALARGAGALGRGALSVGKGALGLAGGAGSALAKAGLWGGGAALAGGAGVLTGMGMNWLYGKVSEAVGGSGSYGSDLYSWFGGGDKKVEEMMKAKTARPVTPAPKDMKAPEVDASKKEAVDTMAKARQEHEQLMLKLDALIKSNTDQTTDLGQILRALREQNGSKFDELITLFERNLRATNNLYESM